MKAPKGQDTFHHEIIKALLSLAHQRRFKCSIVTRSFSKVKAPNKLLSRAYNRHREPCIATVAGDCLCLTRLRLFISVYTIWMKKGAEARSSAFYFTELAVPLVYIFVSSHVLAKVAITAPVADYRRDPPRHFVFSSLAAPTAPPGSALLASPGVTALTSTHNVPNVPKHPSNWLLLPRPTGPGADGDGGNDVDDADGTTLSSLT